MPTDPDSNPTPEDQELLSAVESPEAKRNIVIRIRDRAMELFEIGMKTGYIGRIRNHIAKVMEGLDARLGLEPIEVTLETFDGELEVAALEAEGKGERIPLQDMPSFDALKSKGTAMMSAVKNYFGINPDVDEPVKQYKTQGAKDQPGEGEINVSVYKTDKPGAFIGKREYASGDTVWEVRPLELQPAYE